MAKKAIDKPVPVSDGKNRCSWCGTDALYTQYHDQEWGKTIHDDETFFEFLTLESAQAGLSWITILRRRDGYKKAFANFDIKKVAKFTDEDQQRLLQDEGIIRNRLKVSSAIRNAQLFIEVQKEFGSFDQYLYSFMPGGKPITTYYGPQVRTAESDAIAKDMKKRGFKFFGTTICYAFMQATGMVNDHVPQCDFR
ncbi:DNA-3-methyladenine glycosylase I [Mucilaginibacter glaciei]|uniref:DNA-3-methyladenine glycosylase I n=1 Tax=Mucilaginibacter glaciei TaxID=2772109 RepID=A0A926S6L9_9SPHI|nr:DNA-3-methyladenine glycosylase I [Mucilaginibacter glaciei]MBD1393851.1 DNA-3-methyladenine glycosylase I [Mucilaginibacter glaciei]